MSQYTAELPADGSVPNIVQEFFAKFYRTSDSPDAHEEYASHFTDDGVLFMIADRVQGKEAIIQKRHAMWEKVATRSHKPSKIFSFGPHSDEVMLYGTVDYTLKDGRTATAIEWAARAHFTTVAENLRMDFYQVYLDSASMAAKTA